MNPENTGAEAVGKVTDIFAPIRRCISGALSLTILALALVAMPLCAWAAPYADFVIDARTGEVLHATNADARLHPASLTKMMTLYIAFEAIEHGEITLDTMVTVSKQAASQAPSRLGLRAGQKIALRYLIRGAAIKSANDCAWAIGDALEGDRKHFAMRMNRTAKALGMTRTTFQNANGLTMEGHLSTARDMVTLGRHLFYDYPQYYSIFSRRTADAGIAKVSSTNRRFLDAYEGADGIKTGYTVPAGFNLVASAQRGDTRIIASIFGGKSTAQRNSRMAELLDLGFSKAPRHAPVQPPAQIAYMGPIRGNDGQEVEVASADAEDDVAAAIASDVSAGSAKTLRLQTAVVTSPRPQPKPDATSVQLADGATDDAIEADATAMAQQTDALMASMQDTIDEAVLEAQSDAEAPATDVAAPEVQVASATPADVVTPDPAALATATALAPAQTPLPPAKPAALLAQETTVAPAMPEAVAPAPAEAVIASAEPAATPVDPADPVLAQDVVLAPPPAPAPEPKPEPQTVVLAAAAATGDATVESPEIVTRVSTSGGREYGISVGTFASRYNAEKQLLQVALVEMESLNDALRKVTPRRGAFDANFVGMTQDGAEQACRRLTARGEKCEVISPQVDAQADPATVTQ